MKNRLLRLAEENCNLVKIFIVMAMLSYSAQAQVWNLPAAATSCTTTPFMYGGCRSCIVDPMNPPYEICNNWTGVVRGFNHADVTDISTVRGEWVAACGRDPISGQHEMIYRPLAGLVTLSAEMRYTLNGAAVPAGTVVLTGDLIDQGTVSEPGLQAAFQAQLDDSYIWGCESPSSFLTSAGGNIPNTATGRGTGALGNHFCPPRCALTVPPPARKYKVEFRRSDCLASKYTNCDIPEGYYSVTYNLANNSLQGRKKPVPNDPVAAGIVMRTDGSFSGSALPRGTAVGVPIADGGVGYEYWALKDFINVPAAAGTASCQAELGTTCPDVGNLSPVWPFVVDEIINLPDVSPEMFMMGNMLAEEKRVGSNAVMAPFNTVSGSNYPLFVGPDPDAATYFPGSYGNGTTLTLGNNPKTAPWDAHPGTSNLLRITTLEVPRVTATNQIPPNVPLAQNTLTGILNTLRNGYSGYNIVPGMANNQCALLKAGAQSLNTSAPSSMRKNLIYVGGCPTGWGANTQYNGNNVNWFAFSNVASAGDPPGRITPANLKISSMNTDRTMDIVGQTNSCFTRVASSVDSFFVMTSSSCPSLAATAKTITSGISNPCSGSCRLGVDNASDCAAKLLYCLTGATREVTKN